MKNQALFSSKDKSKELKCRLLQFLFGALRVKQEATFLHDSAFICLLYEGSYLENLGKDILVGLHNMGYKQIK